MRTTLDIDGRLLDEVVEATGEKSRSKAVNEALEEYVRGIAYDRLLAMAGTVEFDEEWGLWRETSLGELRSFESDEDTKVEPHSGR